jgi:hypothetical protein
VIIGDVQGKGLAAIGAGFTAIAAFREAAIRGPTLTGVVEALEDAVVLALAGLGREARTTESFDFPQGATLLVVTDGVTEARDTVGAFYPLDERVGGWAGHGPRELLDALHVDPQSFSGGVRRDDVAALALCRAPGL